jgi:drug/metabolite transporter (DMT)-like permease
VSQRPNAFLFTSLIAVMVLSWSFNFVFAKAGLKQLDPLTLASFRVVLAMVIISGVYLLARGRRDPAKPVRRFSREDFWVFAKLGVLGVSMNQVLFTIGLNYTTVGHSSLIIGTGPITVLVLAWLQGLERLTVKKLLGMTFSFTGVAILAAEQGISLSRGTLRGDLITLAGSIAFAIYTVTAKPVAQKYDSLSMNTYNYIIGGTLILPLAVRQGIKLNWGAVGWQGWFAVVYMAAIASVLAYLIYYWALAHMAASRLAALSYLQPVLATLLSVAILGEKVTGHLLGGGSLILAGVYLTELGPRENGSEAADEDER